MTMLNRSKLAGCLNPINVYMYYYLLNKIKWMNLAITIKIGTIMCNNPCVRIFLEQFLQFCDLCWHIYGFGRMIFYSPKTLLTIIKSHQRPFNYINYLQIIHIILNCLFRSLENIAWWLSAPALIIQLQEKVGCINKTSYKY